MWLHSLTRYVKSVSESAQATHSVPQVSRKRGRYSLQPRGQRRITSSLLLETLEDRLAPAGTLTIVDGLPGTGSLDFMLLTQNGTINPADGGATETVSVAEINLVGANNNISLSAVSSILLQNTTNISLQFSATFSTNTGPISITNPITFNTQGGQTFNALSFTAPPAMYLVSGSGPITIHAVDLTSCSATLAAPEVDVTAQGPIGGSTPFHMATQFIRATSTTGEINLSNNSSAPVNVSIGTPGGDIDFLQTGGGGVTVASLTATNGNVNVTVTGGGNLADVDTASNGNVNLTDTGGNLTVNTLRAGGCICVNDSGGTTTLGDITALGSGITVISPQITISPQVGGIQARGAVRFTAVGPSGTGGGQIFWTGVGQVSGSDVNINGNLIVASNAAVSLSSSPAEISGSLTLGDRATMSSSGPTSITGSLSLPLSATITTGNLSVPSVTFFLDPANLSQNAPVKVTGSASVAGVLTVNDVTGSQPPLGVSIPLITFGSLVGSPPTLSDTGFPPRGLGALALDPNHIYWTERGGTTISLSSRPASSAVYGAYVTETATVISPFGLPGGTVTFLNGSNIMASAPLDSSGKATVSFSNLRPDYYLLQVSFEGNGQYAPSASAPVTLTITPAVLTVTANNAQKNEGDANPPFTATIAGLVNGETLATSGVTGSPSLTTTATAASLAGTYTINVAVGSLTATNYTFAPVNGTLTIRNVAPSVGPITAPPAPQPVGTPIAIRANVTDPGSGIGDSYTAICDWGDGSNTPVTVSVVNGSVSVSGSHTYTRPGLYTIVLTVTDKDGGVGRSTFAYVVIYDPSSFASGVAQFVSPPGNAHIAFYAGYLGPTLLGQLACQLPGNVSATSNRPNYLVANKTGFYADYTGQVNNAGSWHIFVAMTFPSGTSGVPGIRLVITNNSQVLYDNQPGASLTTGPTTGVTLGLLLAGTAQWFEAALTGSFNWPSAGSPAVSGTPTLTVTVGGPSLTGQVFFTFAAANLNFSSTALTSVAPTSFGAQARGTGTINGSGSYSFLLSVGAGSNGLILVRIKITGPNGVICDTQPGAPDSAAPTTPLLASSPSPPPPGGPANGSRNKQPLSQPLLDGLFANVLENRESVRVYRAPEIQPQTANPAVILLRAAKQDTLLPTELSMIASVLARREAFDNGVDPCVETPLVDSLFVLRSGSKG
jgi:hypothetical protein